MTETDGTTFLSGANAEFIAEPVQPLSRRPRIGRRELAAVFRRTWRRRRGLERRARRAGLGDTAPRPAPASAASAATAVRGSAGLQQAATDSIRALQADPRLPRARPSRSRSRPARPRAARRSSRARLPHLRALPRPISTARSSSTICSGASAPPCARSSRLLREIYCGRIGVEYMHIQELGRAAMDPAEIRAPRCQAEPDHTRRKKRCCGF